MLVCYKIINLLHQVYIKILTIYTKLRPCVARLLVYIVYLSKLIIIGHLHADAVVLEKKSCRRRHPWAADLRVSSSLRFRFAAPLSLSRFDEFDEALEAGSRPPSPASELSIFR